MANRHSDSLKWPSASPPDSNQEEWNATGYNAHQIQSMDSQFPNTAQTKHYNLRDTRSHPKYSQDLSNQQAIPRTPSEGDVLRKDEACKEILNVFRQLPGGIVKKETARMRRNKRRVLERQQKRQEMKRRRQQIANKDACHLRPTASQANKETDKSLDIGHSINLAVGTSSSPRWTGLASESTEIAAEPRRSKKNCPRAQSIGQPKPNRAYGQAKHAHPDESIVTTSCRESAESSDVDEDGIATAIMTEPFLPFTKEHATVIEKALETILDNFLFGYLRLSSDPTDRGPSFRGKMFYSDGVLKLWCEDMFTMGWLSRAISHIPSPVEGTRLTLTRQWAIPKNIKAVMFVPNFGDSTLDQLKIRLAAQNPWYHVNGWELYNAKEAPSKNGSFVTLFIPLYDEVKLRERDQRVAYKFGSIHIFFMNQKKEIAKMASVAVSDSACGSTSPIWDLPEELIGLITGTETDTESDRPPGKSIFDTSDSDC